METQKEQPKIAALHEYSYYGSNFQINFTLEDDLPDTYRLLENAKIAGWAYHQGLLNYSIAHEDCNRSVIHRTTNIMSFREWFEMCCTYDNVLEYLEMYLSVHELPNLYLMY